MALPPEKGTPKFEYGMGSEYVNRAGAKGPVYFYEGVQTDTDVPSDFQRGAYVDTAPVSPTSAATNPEHVFKRAEETMRERAHIGSASWIESPEVLADFVQGTVSGDRSPKFEWAYNSGAHQSRPNKVRVG